MGDNRTSLWHELKGLYVAVKHCASFVRLPLEGGGRRNAAGGVIHREHHGLLYCRKSPHPGALLRPSPQGEGGRSRHLRFHLPLEGGGRRNAAGGGDPPRAPWPIVYAAGHPTPELRSDPPPRGEGGHSRHLLFHLPLEGGGRRDAAGGGDPPRAPLPDVYAAGHPTPALRADPPPRGEGGWSRYLLFQDRVIRVALGAAAVEGCLVRGVERGIVL